MDAMSQRDRRYRPPEVAMLIAIGLLVLAHPAYYFFRHGVITPQLLAGGARIGLNLASAPVWFFDLDVGLFSNWPLGAGLLVLAVWAKCKGFSCAPQSRHWVLFVIVYVAISLFAQASTDNLNSGASPSIARYATWYLALFFPAVLMILQWLQHETVPGKALALLLTLTGADYNVLHYYPDQREGTGSPSPLSGWVQTHWPSLYNPPAEIFAERNGGVGENPTLSQALAVIGPDCRKMLIIHFEGRKTVLGGIGCGFDYARLEKIVRQRIQDSGIPVGFTYDRLTDKEAELAKFRCPSRIEFGQGGNLPLSAATGFSGPEQGGRWSDGARASFICWLAPLEADHFASFQIETGGFVINKRRQRMLVSTNDGVATEISYDSDWEKKTIRLNVPPMPSGELRLGFEFPDAISPRKLVASNDPRQLAVWFQSIEFAR
jgi:hypothetical protein